MLMEILVHSTFKSVGEPDYRDPNLIGSILRVACPSMFVSWALVVDVDDVDDDDDVDDVDVDFEGGVQSYFY